MIGSILPAAVAAVAAGVWAVLVVVMSVVMSVPTISVRWWRRRQLQLTAISTVMSANNVGAAAVESSTAAHRDKYGDERTNDVGAAAASSTAA